MSPYNNTLNNEFTLSKSLLPRENSVELLQNRISELETRIKTLEVKKIVEEDEKQDCNLRINDFTPEWDYITGGAKLIICFTPQTLFDDEFMKNVTINFGDISTSAACIQAGVFKCYGLKLIIFLNKILF